ncbi:acyltransferase family protein [Actinomycetes bacterium M1A6_2h]
MDKPNNAAPASPEADADPTGHITDAPVTAPPTRKKAWIAGLEGPRGLAAICVILVHVSVVYTPAIVDTTRLDFLGQALTFFFVLSGFLLYMPYVKRFVDGKARPDTKKYFLSRVRRIFPAYLVVFLIVNFLLHASFVQNPVINGWNHSEGATGMITNPVELLAHLTLTQSWFPSTLQTGINPAWSLTAELVFYLSLPLLGYLLFRFGRRSSRPLLVALIPAGALMVLGVVTNTIVGILQRRSTGMAPLELYWGPNWIAVLSRSFFALADIFAWGMVAAVVYIAITKGAFAAVSTKKMQRFFTIFMIVALAGSLLAFVLGSRYMPSLFAIACCGLILMIVGPLGRGEDSILAKITDWAPLKYLGMISLSAYLWHYPVMIMIERLGFDAPANVLGLAWSMFVVLTLTVIMATATYYLVEKPAMRWRS